MAVARVQRLIGNHATGRYLHRLGLGPVTEAGTGPAVQRDHHQGLVAGGGLKVDGGQAATSWSLGGGAKKPLGIVQAKLTLAGVDRDVDLHVHLNAEDPVDNFTGANVRYRGTATGFAYWPGGAVSATPWLKTALDAGVPDWSKKATWTAVDTDHKIAWQGLRNAGWRFDEAQRAATRRAKLHYWMRFEIGAKGKTQTQAKQAVEDQVPAGTVISAKKVNSNKQWEVTLTFATEQDAYEHAAEVEASVRARWATATFTYEARSADWK